MLECPFCHEQVRPQGRDWFECPACENWVRLRAGQGGSRWLEGGYYANQEIHPLRFTRQEGSAVRPASRPSRPSARQMDLETARAQRQRTAARLRALEEDIQRVISLRNQSLKDEQLTSQYNDRLSRYAREQNDWKLYERQLAQRETELIEEQKEQERARGSRSISTAFVLGTILSGVGLYIFSRLAGLPLSPQASLYLVLIALASGLVTFIISKID